MWRHTGHLASNGQQLAAHGRNSAFEWGVKRYTMYVDIVPDLRPTSS